MILLTNDDGYGSYGIDAVRDALTGAGHTVYISAPAENQSGKSGSINTDHGGAVAFTEEVTDTEWSIEGTPADSVSAALFGLPIPVEIDLVVSGANGQLQSSPPCARHRGIPADSIEQGSEDQTTGNRHCHVGSAP